MSTLAFKRNRFTPTGNAARYKLRRFYSPRALLENQQLTEAGSLVPLVSAGIAVCLLFTAVALAPLLKEPSLYLWLQIRELFGSAPQLAVTIDQSTTALRS